MNNKTLLIIILLALGASWAVGQQTLTVNDGTTTSTTIPIYSYYAKNYNVQSQFIIPASALTDLVGMEISKITFHTVSDYPSVTWPDAEFKVYLLSTDKESFSFNDYVNWESLSNMVVYNGVLSVNNNEMDITLTSPYTYTGNNLLVAFEETTLASSSSYVSWLGIQTSNKAAVYRFDYSGSSYYMQEQFL